LVVSSFAPERLFGGVAANVRPTEKGLSGANEDTTDYFG
jgi:hypothetical protein